MSGSSNTPLVIGASLSVRDSTELAALNPFGLTIGTRVFVQSLLDDFELIVSNASLITDQIVAVLGTNGLRWVRVNTGSSGLGGASARYVSPAGTNSAYGGVGDPMQSIAHAYFDLGAAGGTIYAATGSVWSVGTEQWTDGFGTHTLTAGQGMYTADSPSASGQFPPGFCPKFAIEIKGWGLSSTSPLGNLYTKLDPGSSVTLADRRTASLWMVGQATGTKMTEIGFQSPRPARIGWDYRRNSSNLSQAFANITNAVRVSGLTTLTLALPTPWAVTTFSRSANITTVTWTANELPSAHAGCLVTIASTSGLFPSGTYTILGTPNPVLAGTSYSVSYSDVGPDHLTPISAPGSAASGHMCAAKDIIEVESTNVNWPSTMYEVYSVTDSTYIVVKDPNGPDNTAANIGQYCLQLRNLYASVTNDTFKDCVFTCTAGSDVYRAASGPCIDRGSSTGDATWTVIEGGYYSGAQANSPYFPGSPWIPDLNRGAAIFCSGGSFGRPFLTAVGRVSTESGNIRVVGSQDNAWGCIVEDYTFEASGQVQVPSPVTLDALGASGAYVRLLNIVQADAPNSPAAVDLGFARGQVYVEGCQGVVNSPALADTVTRAFSINENQSWGAVSNALSLEALGRIGNWGNDGRLAGKRVDVQSNFGIYQGLPNIANAVPTALTSWTADAGVTITSGQAAPDGSNTAYKIGGVTGNVTFNLTIPASAAGDNFVFGVWKQGIVPSPPAFVGFQYTGAPNRYGLYTPFYGTGKVTEWDWWTFIQTAQASDAGFTHLVTQIQHQAGVDFTVYLPTLLVLPAATYSANTAYGIYYTLKAPPSYLQPGTVGTMTGQKLIGHGGLGVDSSILVAPAGSVGSSTQMVPIYGANGSTILGYVPLYPGGGPRQTASQTSGMALAANLGDASVTVNPGTDAASGYVLPAATLTVNRTLTLGTGGSPVTGLTVTVFRYDLTAHTFAVVNGGGGGGTLVTFPSGPVAPQACAFTFDGINWGSPTFYYLGY